MPNITTASTTVLALLFATSAIACGGDDKKTNSEQAPPMATATDDSHKNEDSDDDASQKPICGNGKVEADEECDDGNQSDDDDCTHRCSKARCGDGIVSPGEDCDDGNDDDADGCSNECKLVSMNAGSGGHGGSAGGKSSDTAGTGGQGGHGGAGGKDSSSSSDVPGGTPACTKCRTSKCTDYEGLGYNVVVGCFEKIDPQFDAPAMDPTFIQDCTAVVRCAYEKKCGFSSADASECFCGTADTESCFSVDKAANGPCMAEVEQAARSKDLADIGSRFSDKAYPMGWAADLIDCDHHLCQGQCMP